MGFGGMAIDREVYEWLLVNLPKGSTILELGSGAGTQELSKHWKMYSIEHDPEWVGHCKASEYIYAPIRLYSEPKKHRWYNVAALKNSLPKKYDLILIDGPLGSIGRMGFVYNLDLFDTRVPIIVDDTNRKQEMNLAIEIHRRINKPMKTLNTKVKKFTIIR